MGSSLELDYHPVWESRDGTLSLAARSLSFYRLRRTGRRPPDVPHLQEAPIVPSAGIHRWIWIGVLTAAAAVVAALVIHWRGLEFQWREFADTFRLLEWPWILLSTLLALATYFGRALRWRVLIRGVKPDASLWRLASATAIGFTALVLFGRAGELVRPYLIAIKEKVSFPSQIAAWFLERIYDLLTALLIFGFALSRVHSSGVSVGEHLTWVLRVGGWAAAALGAISLGLIFAFSRYASVMESRLLDALQVLPERLLDRARRVLTAFRHGMESNRSAGSVWRVSFYSVLEWALIIACYGCVFRASPVTARLSITDVVIFVGFVAFGAVVQIPGVGGGMQVVSVIVLTELFGLNLAASSGIALMLWAITFVSVVPVGLALAFHEGLNWHKLREIEEKAQI